MEERYAGGRHRLDGAVAGAGNIVVLLRILDRECYIDGTAEVGDTEGRVAMRDIEVVDRGDQVEVRVEDVDGSVVEVSGEQEVTARGRHLGETLVDGMMVRAVDDQVRRGTAGPGGDGAVLRREDERGRIADAADVDREV